MGITKRNIMNYKKTIISIALCLLNFGCVTYTTNNPLQQPDDQETNSLNVTTITDSKTGEKTYEIQGQGLILISNGAKIDVAQSDIIVNGSSYSDTSPDSLRTMDRIEIVHGEIMINNKSHGGVTPENRVRFVVSGNKKTLYVDEIIRNRCLFGLFCN